MTSYSERLWPTPWLFVATLLILPAVALALTPINVTVAIISAILAYLIVGAIMLLSAPKVAIVDGVFTAGPARIPVTIGPGCDARAHLLIRGWIHSGIRVEITDPADPAPYWVLTTRRPAELADAINKARSAT